MKIESSIFIPAPPEKIYAFFEDMGNNYLRWHPDHIKYKPINGEGLKTGNVIYFEEKIGGKLLKKEVVYTEIIPQRYIEFKPTNRFFRFFLPKMAFRIEPQGNGCLFKQEVIVRTGPIGRWLNRKEFAAVQKHQDEECKNLKNMLVPSEGQENK